MIDSARDAVYSRGLISMVLNPRISYTMGLFNS